MRSSKSATARGGIWLGIDNPARAYAFLIAAVMVVALVVLGGAAPIWRLYAWLPPESLRSDRLRISHALATTWFRDVPDIIVLGGSQMREIMPEDEFASAELSIACGRPVYVLNAASSAQLMESSWAIVDHFGDRPPSFVVVGTNLWRVATDPTNASKLRPLLFLLPTAGTMPADAGTLPLSVAARGSARLGIVFADALAALGLGSTPIHPHGDSFDGRQHQYRSSGWTPERKTMDARYQVMISRQIPPAEFQANVNAYLALATSLARRGSRIGFLATPYSPEASVPFRELEPKVVAAFQSLSRIGALLDLRWTSELATTDFYDSVHLVSSGRRKLWPTIKSYLLSGLRDCRS